MVNRKSLTIGKLAKAANVNVETIRYYQRIGLIAEPRRPETGYRLYPAAYIERIGFIKRAKELGFTLDEIRELMSLDEKRCEEARSIAENKRDIIRERIQDLQAINRELNRLISACKHSENNQQRCAMIASLKKQIPTEEC